LLRIRQVTGGNRVSSFLLSATIVLAPLPFGSTDNAVIAVWCGVLGVAVVFASPQNLRREQLAPLAAVAVVVAAYFIVLHEQLVAHPWSGAAPDPIWGEASQLLNVPVDPSISLVHNQAFFAVGAPLAAVLAFSASYIICGDRHRAHQLLRVIAWSGVGYAILGIVLFLIDPTRVFWREKLAYTSSLTATFINRNTAAVYFGSCAVVCFLLFMQHLNARGRTSDLTASSIAREISQRYRELARPFLMLLACLVAMLMTASRAGVVFSLVGLITAYAVLYLRRFGINRNLVFVLIGAVFAALALLQIFGGGVGSRFNENGLGDPSRLATYRSTLRMIAEHPWFGTGLGSFEWSFPAYRSGEASIWGIWNRAHDTLLEVAADLGVPMALLVAALWALALWRLLTGIRFRKRDVIVPAAAFSVAVIGLLHSFVDFSLQIPGYAIVVFALIGAGIAQSYPSARKNTGFEDTGLR
jgi:O-antigen ligase